MPKILYVEDNDDNVYLIRMRFDLLDAYQLLVVEDGETAIAVARAEQPDLILMDLELPVVDGWEATRRLKADPATRAIPIIALSAHALAGSRETALAAGCDDFDTKPVDFDRLMAKIAAVLDAASSSAGRASAPRPSRMDTGDEAPRVCRKPGSTFPDSA